MRNTTQQKLARRKRRILKRLAAREANKCGPVLSAGNIHYQVADRAVGIGCGGIGVIHQVARQTGLADAIDDNVHLLKVHLPYRESDHILNIAYNVLAGGTCLDHLELLREGKRGRGKGDTHL